MANPEIYVFDDSFSALDLATDARLASSLPAWADYWNMGVKGAMFQMIGHGISSAGMFFMVGVVYDRVHHRNLNEFGGLYGRMPIYTAVAVGIFFAALGLPGLCGFIGEVFVVLSVWNSLRTLDLGDANPLPRTLNLEAAQDARDDFEMKRIDRTVTEAALSPDGAVTAMIAYGEVYVHAKIMRSLYRV